VIQQLAVIGCNATISPLVEIQTPLIRFVVDLLWICCRRFNQSINQSTFVKRHKSRVNRRICCTACCTANPQQIV